MADFWAQRYHVLKKALLSMVPFFLFVYVFVFVTPLMGFPPTYGLLLLASSFIGSDAEGLAISIFMGLRSEGTISYLMNIPASSNIVFFALMTSFTLRMLVMTVMLLPLVIPFMPTLLVYAPHPSIVLFFLTLLLNRVVDGALGVWLAGLMQRPGSVTMIWNRILGPLHFLATGAPAWKTCFAYAPRIGICMLFNPYQYIHELARASLFGSAQFIAPWLCIAILLALSLMLTYWGIWRLRKKWDVI